uniref:Uncharacterized protein n=1 Tax=Percolomonas cosmopolitus TaxID=63605 RepID=A0A7S1PGU3_9EUKA|mmetsp:Transcript_3902/g.14740  ORF Transcript_3902/g.14740 Transcript_3902/m.14740 type:complete len:473 (+) Transcript_3902:180-1598(+)
MDSQKSPTPLQIKHNQEMQTLKNSTTVEQREITPIQIPSSAKSLQLSTLSKEEPYSVVSTTLPTPHTADTEIFPDPDKTFPPYDVPPLTPFVSALQSPSHHKKDSHVHFAGDADIIHTHHYTVTREETAELPRKSMYVPRKAHAHYKHTPRTKSKRPNLSIQLPQENKVLGGGTTTTQHNILLDRKYHLKHSPSHKKELHYSSAPFTPLKSADAISVHLPPHVDTHESASQIADSCSPRGTNSVWEVRKKKYQKWKSMIGERLDAYLFPEPKPNTPWILFAKVFLIHLTYGLLISIVVGVTMFVEPFRQFSQLYPFSIFGFLGISVFIGLAAFVFRRIEILNISLLMLHGVLFGWCLGMVGAWDLPIVIHSVGVCVLVIGLFGGWMMLTESMLCKWQILLNIFVALLLCAIIGLTSGLLLAFLTGVWVWWHVLAAFGPVALLCMYMAAFTSRIPYHFTDKESTVAACSMYIL